MATKKTPIPANFETDIPEWQPGMQWSDDTLQRWGAIDAQNRLETQAAQPTGFLRGAADLGLGVAQGVTGLATGLGSVYGLATGDMDNPLRTSAASAGDYLQGLESPTLRARRQLANQVSRQCRA